MARVCVFDVNETLLDMGALDPHFERVFGDASARQAWFDQFLQLWLTEMVTGAYQEFGTIGGAALKMLAESREVEISDDEVGGILGGMKELPPHPEVEEGLSRLREAGFRLATLTNSAPQVGEAQIKNSGLLDYFEQTLSADTARRLKPAPEPYRLAARSLGVEPGEIRLVAAHGWDIAGALRAGCAGAFVARPGKALFQTVPRPDVVGEDLREVADRIVVAEGGSLMESKFVEAGGVRMRWEESGEGPPVVFVHGIPTSPRLWRHVVPEVGGRALAWEMVGYGASIPEGRERDISVARQAEYLAGWMREVGLESGAVVVGHDLGGGVAQILAVRAPELVRGLVLTNSICYDSWPIPSVKAMRVAGPLVERLPDAVVRFNLYAGLFLRGHDDRTRAKESLAEHWPYYKAAGGAAALIRQARSLDVNDTLAVADQIPNLDVPARLVWGAADELQPIGYGYRLAYELGASIERVEGAKHFVPEDHPGEVAAAVNGLLKQTGSADTAS